MWSIRFSHFVSAPEFIVRTLLVALTLAVLFPVSTAAAPPDNSPSTPQTPLARGDQFFVVVSVTDNGPGTCDVKLKNPRTGYIHSVTILAELAKLLKVGDKVTESRGKNGVVLTKQGEVDPNLKAVDKLVGEVAKSFADRWTQDPYGGLKEVAEFFAFKGFAKAMEQLAPVFGPFFQRLAGKIFGKTLTGHIDEAATLFSKDPAFRREVAEKVFGPKKALQMSDADLQKLDVRQLLQKGGTDAGNVWESYALRREGAIDLNKAFNRNNFPVVDAQTGTGPTARYASLAFGSEKYYQGKVDALLGFKADGRNVKEAAKLLGISEGDFLKRSQLVVPTSADAQKVQKWIADNLGKNLHMYGEDVYQRMQAAWGSDAAIREGLQNLVRSVR